MGSDYRWVMCSLTPDQYQSVENDFRVAQKPASMSEEHKTVYELCRQSPQEILPRYIPADELPPQFDRERYRNGYIDAELSGGFSSAFLVPQFHDLFYRLPLNQETMLKYISCDLSPVATLYYSLGISLGEQLPGYFGNMLVIAKDLKITIHQVDAVLGNLDDGAWDRARRYISPCSAGKASVHHDEDILELFSALPQALRAAYARRQSFAAVAL
jgi:hypothetical protein